MVLCVGNKLEGLVEATQLSFVDVDLVLAFSDHERVKLSHGEVCIGVSPCVLKTRTNQFVCTSEV